MFFRQKDVTEWNLGKVVGKWRIKSDKFFYLKNKIILNIKYFVIAKSLGICKLLFLLQNC